LAFAALALVVFGAYDSYPKNALSQKFRIVELSFSRTGIAFPKIGILFLL